MVAKKKPTTPAKKPKAAPKKATPPKTSATPTPTQPERTFGLSDVGDTLSEVFKNPLEYAMPAMMGIPLGQVFEGAFNRLQRSKQTEKGAKPSEPESSIIGDVMSAEGAGKSMLTDMLLKIFGLGG